MVEIFGLKSKARQKLNGEIAIVRDFVPSSGRYEIEFQVENTRKERKAIEPRNLRHTDHAPPVEVPTEFQVKESQG